MFNDALEYVRPSLFIQEPASVKMFQYESTGQQVKTEDRVVHSPARIRTQM
jgi:hypothetical protein